MHMHHAFNQQMRHHRFGSGAVIITARGDQPLALAELQARTPSVFATQAHESRSDRFVPIPTATVLQALQREGFEPFEVRQGGARDEGKRGFTKHMLRLRRRGDTPREAGLGGLIPEVILVNANDGTAAYHLLAGIFRVICTNGLIAGDFTGVVRVSHGGRPEAVVSKVIDGTYEVVRDMPRVIDNARSMGAVTLAPAEQQALARAAMELRWQPGDEGAEPAQPSPITVDQALRPRRVGDNRPDLWSTFNVLQENIVRGGQHYVRRNANNQLQRRTVGEVRSVDQTRGLNRALWTLAEEMRRIKAA